VPEETSLIVLEQTTSLDWKKEDDVVK